MSNGRSQNSNTGLSDLQITMSCTLSVPLKLDSPSESIPSAQEERDELMGQKALPKPPRTRHLIFQNGFGWGRILPYDYQGDFSSNFELNH